MLGGGLHWLSLAHDIAKLVLDPERNSGEVVEVVRTVPLAEQPGLLVVLAVTLVLIEQASGMPPVIELSEGTEEEYARVDAVLVPLALERPVMK